MSNVLIALCLNQSLFSFSDIEAELFMLRSTDLVTSVEAEYEVKFDNVLIF